MVEFGIRLKLLRKSKNMTQKMLADRLDLATSAVCSYEAGARFPSYEVLIKIARIFRVSTDYLLGVEEKRTVDVSDLSEEDVELLNRLSDSLREKNR